ncbi:MAG: hypothetical protein JRN52_13315 [Nitrososphaerota archaeon]|nr:hypothetical protein [Nitrososphaerota archaeon]
MFGRSRKKFAFDPRKKSGGREEIIEERNIGQIHHVSSTNEKKRLDCDLLIAVVAPSQSFTTVEWALAFSSMRAYLPVKTSVVMVSKYALDVARNKCVEIFLESNAKHLFFLDSDTIPPSNAIQRMLQHDKPIVSGNYCGRRYPFQEDVFTEIRPNLLLNGEALRNATNTQSIEVEKIGCGCLSIRREVCERMEAPYFKFQDDLGNEDSYFCAKAKELGYKIVLDLSVQCRHFGIVDYIECKSWCEFGRPVESRQC